MVRRLLPTLQLQAIPRQGWALKALTVIPIQNSSLGLKDFPAIILTMVLSSQLGGRARQVWDVINEQSQNFTITMKFLFPRG